LSKFKTLYFVQTCLLLVIHLIYLLNAYRHQGQIHHGANEAEALGCATYEVSTTLRGTLEMGLSAFWMVINFGKIF
jgi:hypothetical protein